MAAVIQSVIKSMVPTNFLRIPFSHFSTAVANTSSSTETEEPDKLYKTIQLEMRACESATMKSYEKFITMAANHLGIKIGKCWAPVKPFHDRSRLTILRSRHVHKKHRVQYEVRTYYRFMTFHNMTGSTADTFLEYIERNLSEGVALKITKVALEMLPDDVFSQPKMEIDENEQSATSNQ